MLVAPLISQSEGARISLNKQLVEIQYVCHSPLTVLAKTTLLPDHFFYFCSRNPAISYEEQIVSQRMVSISKTNLIDSQSVNENSIACDNLIPVSRLARLGPREGRYTAHKLPVRVFSHSAAVSGEI